MYSRNPYEQYKSNSITTAGPGEMLVMLFEGCWKFLKKAKVAIIEKDIPTANENLIKAQNILMELMTTLDFRYQISNDLFEIYNFMYRELVQVNIHKDAERLEPIIKLVYEYYETWKQAAKQARIENSKSSDRSYV